MNSLPPSACSQAGRSLGEGTAYVPPGEGLLPAAGGRLADLEQAATLSVVNSAAIPPADCRKRRRSIPFRAAAVVAEVNVSRAIHASVAVAGAGMNSPLETGPRHNGSGAESSQELTSP